MSTLMNINRKIDPLRMFCMSLYVRDCQYFFNKVLRNIFEARMLMDKKRISSILSDIQNVTACCPRGEYCCLSCRMYRHQEASGACKNRPSACSTITIAMNVLTLGTGFTVSARITKVCRSTMNLFSRFQVEIHRVAVIGTIKRKGRKKRKQKIRRFNRVGQLLSRYRGIFVFVYWNQFETRWNYIGFVSNSYRNYFRTRPSRIALHQRTVRSVFGII